MTHSANRKVLKSFQARESLWDAFEQRAIDMECSVDYLINESMRLYATAHDLFGRQVELEDLEEGLPTHPPAARPSAPPPAPRPSSTGGPPPPPPPMSSSHPPGPFTPSFGTDELGARPRLTLIYQGQKFLVQGEQFIIGRGSKSSDLPIKDVNISRKHAAVIFHNGAFYIKDLGSTNGVEFKERQVDSKRIDEGDVFSICGHELHFTYSV